MINIKCQSSWIREGGKIGQTSKMLIVRRFVFTTLMTSLFQISKIFHRVYCCNSCSYSLNFMNIQKVWAVVLNHKFHTEIKHFHVTCCFALITPCLSLALQSSFKVNPMTTKIQGWSSINRVTAGIIRLRQVR